MMTEQRAIDLLKGILPKKVSYANLIGALNCYGDKFVYESPEPYAIEFAINSIQENTKLKAEIEQLKEELEQSVKLQEVLLRATWGSEWSRCYMCDNSMKNITLDGKNNGCDGSCYHSTKYTKEDLLDKIKREIDRAERTGVG